MRSFDNLKLQCGLVTARIDRQQESMHSNTTSPALRLLKSISMQHSVFSIELPLCDEFKQYEAVIAWDSKYIFIISENLDTYGNSFS